MAVLICSTLLIRGFMVGEVTGLNIDTANNVLHYFMLAVVIVVAAVPEGLPMSVALSLSLAMRKMTRANCLVRRLIACETIGSATTICTDKTGTLTKNQMEVVESPAGKPEHSRDLPQTPAQWITLNAAVNGTAHLEEREAKVIVIGNSTEGALLRWLREYKLDYMQIRAETRTTKQYLFDGNRKRMSTVVDMDGRSWLLVKGAPEIVAGLCTEKPDLSGVSVLASRAMRTLAFAHKEVTGGDEQRDRAYVGRFCRHPRPPPGQYPRVRCHLPACGDKSADGHRGQPGDRPGDCTGIGHPAGRHGHFRRGVPFALKR